MGDCSVTNATNPLVIEAQRLGSAIDYRGSAVDNPEQPLEHRSPLLERFVS